MFITRGITTITTSKKCNYYLLALRLDYFQLIREFDP